MNFKIGDIVKVIDTGETYSTFSDWVSMYVSDELSDKWVFGVQPNKFDNFVIKVIAPNIQGRNIAYIQNEIDKKCYIVGLEGLKKIITRTTNDNDNDEPIICDHCGCVIEDDYYTEFDNKIWCDDCRNDELAYCEECNELHYRDECSYLENYNLCVCDDCLDNEYTNCACCDEYVRLNDGYETEDGFVCEYCRDDHYYCCDDCGTVVHEANIYWDEDGDYCYCYDCYHDHKTRVIHNYSYKPEPIFYATHNEKQPLYMGIELELDKAGCDSEKAQILLNTLNNDNEYIYIKTDGSLNRGFEIVSHPATLNYHTNNINWHDLMNKAVELEYRSHDTQTCGLHIHVGRMGLGWEDDEQEKNISKIVHFVEKYWDNILIFTRRNEEQMSRWASRYGIEATPQDTYEKAKGDYCRYRCINLLNDATIEFRMFRGTLKYSTFVATLQFVQNVVDYCMELSDEELNNSKWSDFTNYISHNKYGELIEYLTLKELM